MQRQVLQDEKAATHIIAGELHHLFHDAANITKMTYRCKLTGYTLPCINSKDIRQAWMQDGSEDNMQCLAWMFYYYGTEIHKLGRSTLTLGEWVEQRVMSSLNVLYVHLGELPVGHRTASNSYTPKSLTISGQTLCVEMERSGIPAWSTKNNQRVQACLRRTSRGGKQSSLKPRM
jgi:hypothetical protein